jgi:hypothetical protein
MRSYAVNRLSDPRKKVTHERPIEDAVGRLTEDSEKDVGGQEVAHHDERKTG